MPLPHENSKNASCVFVHAWRVDLCVINQVRAKAREILGASKRRGGDGETVGPRDQGIFFVCAQRNTCTRDAITVMRESEIALEMLLPEVIGRLLPEVIGHDSPNTLETMPKLVVRRFIGPTII
jgi:hypothetical protein